MKLNNFNKQTVFAISWRALLIACILGGYWLAVKPPKPKTLVLDDSQAIESQVPRAITKRIVYRYSVVEGGVHMEEDIEEARQIDSIVDEHYRYTPKPDRLVLITAVVKGYVSYRKGNQIYWTKQPVEFTDWVWAGDVGGEFRPVIRARCGNRVSDVPMLPVLAQEPNLDELALDGVIAFELPVMDLLAGLPMVTKLGTPEAELGPNSSGLGNLGSLGYQLSPIPALALLEPLVAANDMPFSPWGGPVILPFGRPAAPSVDFGPVPEPGTWLVGIAIVLGAIWAKLRKVVG